MKSRTGKVTMAVGNKSIHRNVRMSKLILDRNLQQKLSQASSEVELCDEAGEAFGYFLPPRLYQTLLYAWARAEFAADEDRQRALQEVRLQGGLSTAEVLDYLRGLSKHGIDAP